VTVLTPESLLRLYALSPEPPESLGQLVRHALAGSAKSQNRCQHLLHLFFEYHPDLTAYWDLYLAHYRWQGARLWNQMQDSSAGDLDAALARLPAKPCAEDWGLVEALCETSRRLAASDREAAARIARAALARARRAPEDVLGTKCRPELQALAWATLANVYRAHDQLEPARRAMKKAMARLEQGRPHLLGLAPAVLSLRAGLEASAKDYPRSLETFAQALAMHPPDELRARILVKISASLIALGDSMGALANIEEAIPLIDREADPRLWYCTVQHQLFILTELSRFEEAAALVPKVRNLVSEGGTPVHETRVRWIEARLALGQGEPGTAETLYHQVRQEFLDHQLAYSAAIVTLELAELLFEQGRLEEVKRHAASTLHEFRRQRVESQFISALALVEQAVIGQRLTVEILRKARALVEQR